MTQASTDMADYYQQRASYYDRVYEVPERQSDLQRLRELVPALLAGCDVLEVAAGTGYWTQFVAAAAASVYATDVNSAPLAVAAARDYPRANVRFAHGDAFGLDRVPGVFTGALVGFWWSHLLRGQTSTFLDGLCRRLEKGSAVVIIDNRYVEGSSGPIVDVDEHGNTFQRRILHDGRTYEVVKNFPTADELLASVRPFGEGAEVTELEHYWLLRFTT
ncbi:class I SAM-dependent methyltransferase [Dactylosporangium sp. NPDC049525]|uniref:class I SAM-dependent methyltransferase n=1 Tax=Dactylosporangium sp. NPDC049525 TaxID=3154730 RepID=UPI00344A55AF